MSKSIRQMLLTGTLGLILILLGTSVFSQQTTTVRFIYGTDPGGAMRKTLDVFESQNPEIKVDLLSGPDLAANIAIHDMFVTMFASQESSVDVIYCDVIWPPEFVSSGWLEPLDKWFAPEYWDQFVPAMVKANTVRGKAYAVPGYTSVLVMYYRKDLLAEAGFEPPRTWEELVDQSKEIMGASPGTWGYIADWARDEQISCNFAMFLAANKAAILDEENNVVVNSPKAIESLQMMYDMLNKDKIMPPGVLTWSLEEGRIVFTEGNAVFHTNWGYAWASSQKEGSKVQGKVGIMTPPAMKGGVAATNQGGWSYAINAFSKNKDAAAKLLRFLGDPETGVTMALEAGRPPGTLATYEDTRVLARDRYFYTNYLDVVKAAVPRPRHPLWRQMSDILQFELQSALYKEKAVKEALDSAAAKIEPLARFRLK